MTKNDMLKEKFYRGEYLGFFADSLVSEKYATIKKSRSSRGTRDYIFNHPNLDKLQVTISQEDMCLFHALSYDVTIKGPEEQVKEFKRAAERHLEKGIHSLECAKKQLQR
jgi:hypothetical protein